MWLKWVQVHFDHFGLLHLLCCFRILRSWYPPSKKLCKCVEPSDRELDLIRWSWEGWKSFLCLVSYKVWAGWGDISGFTSMTSKTKHPTVSWLLLSFFSISSNNTSAATLAVWTEVSPLQPVIKFSYVFIRYQMWWKKVTSPGKSCMRCGDGMLMDWGRRKVYKCNDLLMSP